jgi:hypothetical protein
MERHFRKGHLEPGIAVEPFDSAWRLLGRSIALFAAALPFIALLTLTVFIPGKLVLQFACYVLDIPVDGALAYVLLDLSDLVLGALAIPAIIYGLTARLRTGRTPPVGECLRWGRRLWGRMLWNKFKVEITIALWSLLIFVPGIIAMVRLSLTDPALSVEGDNCMNPLERSRELAAGHGWRIFFVLAPLTILDTAGSFLVLGALARQPRWMLALGDSAMAVVNGWTTVALLLIYLSLTGRASPNRP